jgi:cytochrome b
MNTKTFADSAREVRGNLRAVRARTAKAAKATDTGPALIRIRVWDLPTRLFHWALVLAVATAVITGEIGGSLMDIHATAGLTIVGLVTFRLVWGFVGSTNARFLNFLPTPRRIRSYFKGRWEGHGHSPLGALSVLALLGLLAVQAGTGLFCNDDIAFTGPLYALVEETLANRLSGLHRQLANVLLALLALHVVAILAYLRFKKDNLVKPMITGWKEVRSGTSASRGGPRALIVALLAAVVAVYFASGGQPGKPAPAPVPVQQSSTTAW